MEKEDQKGGKSLTEQQERFVRAYREMGDAARAYIAAYPRIKHIDAAHRMGEKLLKKPEIERALRGTGLGPVADEREIMEFYSAVMRGQSPDDGPIKLSERIAAADKLTRLIASDGRGDMGELAEIMEAVDEVE